MYKLNFEFPTELSKFGAVDLYACYNCGCCTAICPMGLDILPRVIFRHALMGFQGNISDEKESIFSCLLCKRCEESCPNEVPIAGNIRTLRHYINCEEYNIK
jgi:heterodisulfide reductase subunit C